VNNDVEVVIIKKSKRAHGGHHGGAWKVAYADFVTAMMAFFLVLWLVGQSKQMKQAVGQYFRDPGAFSSTVGGVLSEGTSVVPAMGERLDIAASPEAESLETLHRQQQQAQELILGRIREKLQNLLVSMPELARFKEQVSIDITEEGLRIDLLEKDGSSFFEVGSSRLQPSAVTILRAVAEELRPLPNLVVIEGHTDSRPYASPTVYSNWELSTDRAHSARRVIEKYGVRPEQIVQVRGYADRKPRYPENAYDIRNRRVSILIAYAA
jgi:chemotaxis protein MotB